MNSNTNNDYLLVIDIQNDFITGSLGNKEAQEITDAVNEKITSSIANNEILQHNNFVIN